MEKFKMNLNREKISSEQIQGYQNFNQLKSDYKLMKKAYWKSPWFIGAGGIVSIASVVLISFLNLNKSELNEINFTPNDPIVLSDVSIHTEMESSEIIVAESSNTPTKNQSPIPVQHNNVADFKVSNSESIKKTLRLDILENEFPNLAPIIGADLEIVDDTNFDVKWFEKTWEDISLVAINPNEYVVHFSDGKVANKLTVRKI